MTGGTRLMVIAAALLGVTCGPGPSDSQEHIAAVEEPAIAPSPEADRKSGSRSGSPVAPTASEPQPATSAQGGPPTMTRPRITALGVDPIDAADLYDAYYHWQDEEITVVGYPAQLFASAPWTNHLDLGARPEPKATVLARCAMAAVPDGPRESATAVVVRGTFHRRWFPTDPPRLELSGCTLVETAGSVPTDGDPWALGGGPIPVPLLHEAAFGWQGRAVRVTGRWVGTTISRPKSGAVTRFDLQGAAGSEPAVGCEQAGEKELPQELVGPGGAALVEGTIAESHPGRVTLADCRFLKYEPER